MLIPRESFLLYLKFNAGYSVFSSAKSDNPFSFVSKCLWSSPTEEHFTRSQSFFPLKTRVAGTLHVGMASAFDFYSWGIHLFLKAKHVSSVAVLFCFVFSTSAQVSTMCSSWVVRARPLLYYVPDGCMRTFNLVACSGRSLCGFVFYFCTLSIIFLFHHCFNLLVFCFCIIRAFL